MAAVEFISHSKHLGAVQRVAGASLVAVPVKRWSVLQTLARQRGLTGLLRVLLDEKRIIDINPLVERNLLRRKIRLPWLYSLPFSAAIYRLVLRSKARAATALLEDTFATHPQARALVFNGFLMPDSLTLAVSHALGRQRLVMELGFFPGTTQVDVNGVNDECTLPRDPAFYAFVAPDISTEKPTQLVRRTSKQKQQATFALPAKYVFAPMQVPSDMQILHHSPWIKDMVHFHTVLVRLAEQDPSLHVVVKEHPSFPLSIRNQITHHPRVIFANDRETRALIEGADAVVTINSTVGLESLLLGKKVITLGRAHYNLPGLTRQVHDEEELLRAISNLEHWQPDPILCDRFVRYVYNVFLIHADRNKADTVFWNALRERAEQRDSHHSFLNAFRRKRMTDTGTREAEG